MSSGLATRATVACTRPTVAAGTVIRGASAAWGVRVVSGYYGGFNAT